MNLILLLVVWVTVGWEPYMCERMVHENTEIVLGHPEMVDTICRGFIKYTDSGERITNRHIVHGCFSARQGKALILWNGDKEVLEHELNHARDYFCR